MRTRRIVTLTTLALVALAVLSGCGGKKHDVPANAVAVVGNQTISMSVFNEALSADKASYLQNHGSAFPALGSNAYEAEKVGVVADLVVNAYLEDMAAKLGLLPKQSAIAAQRTQLIQSQAQGNKKMFEAQLRSYGISDQYLDYVIRVHLIDQQLALNGVAKDVKISKDEIKAYYDQNKSSYAYPKSRSVSHILIGTKSKTDPKGLSNAAAKAKIDQIYQQLKAAQAKGAAALAKTFAALAKKDSTDKGTAVNGGALGSQQPGATVAPFEKVMFALKTGALSKPFKTDFGWHIILATNPTIPAGVHSLATEQATILNNLQLGKWYTAQQAKAADAASYQTGYAPSSPTPTVVATTS